jgi:hypothetical protein
MVMRESQRLMSVLLLKLLRMSGFENGIYLRLAIKPPNAHASGELLLKFGYQWKGDVREL